MIGEMGEVVDLAEYRARRVGPSPAVARLDEVVRRLEPLVRTRSHKLAGTVERELLAIAADVSAGRPHLAVRRAERLVDRLEHPAALGS